MYRILIIEDDQKLRKTIQTALKETGYDVYVTDDFENIEEVYKKIQPHLTLLDIQLPFLDGFIICKLLRKHNNAPIIIMSARNTEDEQIFGMELGADEYIVKPFGIGLLKAKIQAIIRRIYEAGNKSPTNDHYFICGSLKLDTHKMILKNDKKSSTLSRNEFILLKTFFQSDEKIIKREELMMRLWDDEHFIDENTLNVNIKRVKDRLDEVGVNNVIKTKRGVGYLLDMGNCDK